MPTDEQRQKLVQQIERVRPQIIDGMYEAIYTSPFWEARFGEKGMKHTRLDINYHINQLISAISLDLPSLAAQYYHWLQGLLLYRGMCTLHVQETIDGLADQIARLLPEVCPAIEPYLRAGEEGLVYSRAECRAFFDVEQRIALTTTVRAFEMLHLDQAMNERAFAACLHDNRYHLSFLCDAVEIQVESNFEKYVDWLTGFLPGVGVSLSDFFVDLQILAEEIGQALPPETAAPFTRLIEQALRKQADLPQS